MPTCAASSGTCGNKLHKFLNNTTQPTSSPKQTNTWICQTERACLDVFVLQAMTTKERFATGPTQARRSAARCNVVGVCTRRTSPACCSARRGSCTSACVSSTLLRQTTSGCTATSIFGSLASVDAVAIYEELAAVALIILFALAVATKVPVAVCFNKVLNGCTSLRSSSTIYVSCCHQKGT